jgi:trehalose 6-phosphate synthase
MFGRLIVVSNLAGVPSRHESAQADGLVVAMRTVLKRHPGIWFGWGGSHAPGEVHSTRAYRHAGVSYVVTDLTQEDHDEYYNGFANRVLWPLLHYRLDLAEFSRRDLTGYLRVNHHFASELHRLLQPDTFGCTTIICYRCPDATRTRPSQSNGVFSACPISTA